MRILALYEILNKRPLVIFAISYIAGLIIGLFILNSIFFILIFSFLFLLLLSKILRKKTSIIIVISIFFVLLGLFRVYIHSLPFPKSHISNVINDKEKVNLEGLIISPPQFELNKTRFFIEAKKIHSREGTRIVNGKAKITIYESYVNLKYKDRVLVKKIRLHPPIGFQNFNTFNYQSYMQRQGIYVIGGVSKGSRVEILERNEKGIINTLFTIKNKILKNIDSSLPFPTNRIIKAIVWGNRGLLDRDIIEVFNNSGIAHLLAISGLHIGFIAFTSFFLIYKLIFYIQYFLIPKGITYLDSKKIAALITIFPIFIYAIMVGNRIPTLRAGIMIYTYLLAIILDRHRDLYNILALAVIILLVWNPLSFYNIGFQLSFIAVLGIIFCISNFLYNNYNNTEIKKERFNFYSLIKKRIFQYLIVSLAASLSVLPIISLYFNKLIFVSPISNFIILPFASFLIPFALFSSLLGLIYTPIIGLTSWIINIFSSTIFYIAKFFSSLPFSYIFVSKPSLLILLLYYTALFTIFTYKKIKLKKVLIASLLLLIIVFFSSSLISSSNNPLMVTFLDVGQGESTFIRTPLHQSILIDGGGAYNNGFKIGEKVVLPFLLNHGVRKIDLMIATHPHPDHMKGLVDIVNTLKVKEIFLNKDNPNYSFYRELSDVVLKKEIKVKRISSPFHYNIGEVDIIFFHPSDKFNNINSKVRDENNRSLAFKLIYRNFSILFTGDIENKAEEYILANNYPLKANILKIPHHGSRTSSTREFLKEVDPDIAVISVGRYNWFRLPSIDVIERLKERDIEIYRTDKHGSIRVLSNGNEYFVETFK